MSERDIKHLEFIEAVVVRMNSNSFLIKGWSVTLVSALFALAAKDTKIQFAIIAYIPLVVFWALDGFYLSQERRYRALYDAVRGTGGGPAVSAFDMEASTRGGARASWTHSVVSSSILLFHGALVVVTLTVMCILLKAR